MEKIEKKIIDQVFAFETKKTALQIIMALISGIFFISLFILYIIIISAEVQSIYLKDYFAVFGEDIGTIRFYLWDIVKQIYSELPKAHLFVALLSLSISLILVIAMLFSFSKFKKKLRSITKYWLKKFRAI